MSELSSSLLYDGVADINVVVTGMLVGRWKARRKKIGKRMLYEGGRKEEIQSLKIGSGAFLPSREKTIDNKTRRTMKRTMGGRDFT